MRRALVTCLSVLLLGVLPVSAQPWTAIRLHNEQFLNSYVNAVAGGKQFGRAAVPSATHPSGWSGTAQSWTSFIGAGAGGEIHAAWDSLQGGAWNGRASIWSGTPESRVDLHPQGTFWSSVLGIGAEQQTGEVQLVNAGPIRASLWLGTAESRIDLHPSGASQSMAYATDGTYQGGRAYYTTVPKPILWAGTAQSAVDMTPAGALGGGIYSMVPGQQAGYIQLPSGAIHAARWSGTPGSFIDMNPPGVGLSYIYGTCGTAQAGYASLPGIGNRAVVWFGTPESYISLAGAMPPHYGESVATSIAFHEDLYHVGGRTFNQLTSQNEAFLWIGIPAPATLAPLATAAIFLRPRRRSRY